MPLIDHISVGVPDIEEARSFYDPVLATLKTYCLASGQGFATFGQERTEFLLLLPFNQEPVTYGNGTHIGFAAKSRFAVDAFHETALTHGGTDEGRPGPRTAYPMENVYCAYVRDPYGNKLEVIFNGFSAT